MPARGWYLGGDRWAVGVGIVPVSARARACEGGTWDRSASRQLWDSAILMVSCRLHTYIAQGRTVGVSERAGKQEGLA